MQMSMPKANCEPPPRIPSCRLTLCVEPVDEADAEWLLTAAHAKYGLRVQLREEHRDNGDIDCAITAQVNEQALPAAVLVLLSVHLRGTARVRVLQLSMHCLNWYLI